MDTVTVRELRQNLSVYLRRVEAGETLRVLRRGEPAAILAPLPERRNPTDWLVAERGATPPSKRISDLRAPARLGRDERISDALDELREDRPLH